ncbi:MAG: hypothetical protein KF784_03505 [Fimbriimonadaceae bacterium]|nr:hypothetical protein [Fimbriimonadaceae bacterium]
MHDVDPEAINAETRPELGYDHRDANWKTVWKIYRWYSIFATVMVVISVGIQWTLTKTAPGKSYRAEHTMTPPRDPNPVLQSSEQAKLDITNMRRDAKKRLESFGQDVVTKQTWIPIDRAMELTVEKGINPPAKENSN